MKVFDMFEFQNSYQKYKALELECKIMIFYRHDCPCSEYWARNGKLMIPEILADAERRLLDPLELFCDYAKMLHDGHLHEMERTYL